ncbi:hypothetical protein [Longimicrobium sp.]|uniref:hypothetical protein n=1 Tax=Longimicrobium sp. TaxID=2029185 RepID=UPI002C9776D9|nr:hypothetical protein [Longimicrobium sp.]HSU17487.1 hypothetical protein [Longimicrobium sp.]
MRIVVASKLAVLATAAAFTPAWGQPREGLADCGARPPMRYAAVFDASSSVRDNPALRAETEASYRKLLGLLAGLLCTGDKLAVYTFVADSATRMDPLVEITSSSRTPSLLSVTAQRVIEARSSHTDLQLVTRGIVRDVIPDMAPDAIFVVTDGSYYPLRPTPGDRTLAGVRDRLTALATFVTDSVRPDSSRVFVIGVNAANSYAVDRQLDAVLPAASSQRRWKNVDLLDDHGEDLLGAVFGARYIGLSDLSLWDVLVGLPQSVWARRLGYLTDRDLPWNEVSTLSVQHLVYVPGGPGGSTSCALPAADSVPARVEQAGYAVAGGVLCSLGHPTPAQIAAIHVSSRFYAFRQGTSLWPAASTDHVRGLNDVLLRDSSNECSGGSVRNYFARGNRWPPPDAPHVGELRISPVDIITWSEPIELIRLGSAGCVVPRFTSGEWPGSPGDYFVKVAHDRTSVFRVTVDSARSQVMEAYIRPGGLPFPSDRIALVRVCVRTRPALSGHERMWMHLGDRFLLLTLERGRRCASAASGVAAFSGLVGLEHTDRGSAEVFVVNENDDPDSPQYGEWVPVTLKRDGKLFLSWLYLGLSFMGGMVVQMVYACVTSRGFHADRLGRIATWSGAVVSGIIVAVVAEFVVLVMETDVDSDRIPVIFALSVLAHMVKLLAATLVPEHVEEFLLTD